MATRTMTSAGSEAGSSLEAYGKLSSRPLMSLLFIAPLLLVYEVGVIWQGPAAMRNGADVWLRSLLEYIGFGQYLLLPILTCCLLLAWHHLARQPWKIETPVLPLMFMESGLLAVALLGVAQMQSSLMAPPACVPCAAGGSGAPLAERLVSYCGAGIYEELLFRLMLLPAVAGMALLAGAKPKLSWGLAIVLTSVVFSAAHYDFVTPYGEPFDMASFSFRLLAGGFFAVLFVYRGFGIAAGTHALYDVLVALV